MIKFKEHDGLIFKMLEEHEILPLRENDVNVLVRFITHGVIGEYVMEHWLDCNQENVPIYVEDVDSDGDVTVWIDDVHHCCPFPMFEIIGTFVKEGSEDWAWYKMMKGEKISYAGMISQRFYAIKEGCDYCAFYESDGNEVRINTRRTYGEFIEYSKLCDKNVWQIYKEPKPLLAEAKVGDLVKLRNGSYSQIVEVKDGSVFKYQNPEAIERSSVALFLCDENGDTSRWGKVKDVDIIFTEPLAPESTKEWALQMMKLGKCVCHVKAPSIKYHRPTHYVKRVVRENCTDDMSDAVWMKGADPTGWQLYEPEQLKTMPVNEFADLLDAPIGWICKTRDGGSFPLKYIEVSPTRYAYEDKSGLTVYVMANGRYKKNGTDGRDIISCEHEQPKPEPIFTTGDKVTDGVIEGTIIHIEDAIADVCPSTDEYKIELRNLNHIPESPKQDDVEKPLRSMIAEAKAIGKNIRTYYQDIVFTPQALEACLNQCKFRWWNICNWELTTREQNYFPPISTSSDEPNHTYKVGDWVKYDIDTYLRVIEASGAERTWCKTLSGIAVYPYTSCLSKVKPSQVVIKIGCLSGTIRRCLLFGNDVEKHDAIKIFNSNGKNIAIIQLEAIDTPTLEIVESLLKAQEEAQE